MTLTIWSGSIGLILCASILALVFWLIRREIAQRTDAEDKLQGTITQIENLSKETLLLSKLGEYLQSCQSLDEAFIMLNSHIPPLLPGTFGAVSLLNNSHNALEIVSKWRGDHDIANGFEPQQCWALRRGTPHFVHNDNHDPMCMHTKTTPAGGSLCIPMQAHGEIIGMFYIGGLTADSLDVRKQAIARALSEQASLAIANLKLQQRLRQQSVRDPLTQLYNRRYLQETLDRELSRAKRNNQELCVLVIDVDHFKKFNDTYGHDAGDALLVNFANLLRTNVRTEDIVCRYGGEEFVVVLPFTNQENGLARANILCENTRKMVVKLEKQNIGKITISIGMSVFPTHAHLSEDLITRADEALYTAKQSGRNRVVLAD